MIGPVVPAPGGRACDYKYLAPRRPASAQGRGHGGEGESRVAIVDLYKFFLLWISSRGTFCVPNGFVPVSGMSSFCWSLLVARTAEGLAS